MNKHTYLQFHRLIKARAFNLALKILLLTTVVYAWPLPTLIQSLRHNPVKQFTPISILSYLSPDAAYAHDANLIFGPEKYIRTKGMPNEYIDSFSAPAGNSQIIILNGDKNGEHRVSSAIITVNGRRVFVPSDFNQKVYRLEDSIKLFRKNILRVELRSKPESYLTIKIITTETNTTSVQPTTSSTTSSIIPTTTTTSIQPTTSSSTTSIILTTTIQPTTSSTSSSIIPTTTTTSIQPTTSSSTTSSIPTTTAPPCLSLYRVLVLLMSQTPQDTTSVLAQLNDLAADIARLSYNRVCLSYDVRVYQATPADMGCTGGLPGDDRVRITSYGVGRAIADGVDIVNTQHVIMAESQDLYPGCQLGGASGGQGYGVAGIQPSTGVELMGSGWAGDRILWAHEFLHGYGPRDGVHEAVLTCGGPALYAQSSTQEVGYNTSCTAVEIGPGAVPQEFDALGVWGIQNLDSGWNESAARKLYLQWIAPSESYSLSPAAAAGIYTFTIYAEDEGTPSAVRPVALQIPLAGAVPPGVSQSYVVEYRSSALLGPGSPPANVPGVYVHLMEVRQSGFMFSYLMKTTTDPNNLSGIAPVAPGVPVQLALENVAQPATTANITMTVQSVDTLAGTATIAVTVSRQ